MSNIKPNILIIISDQLSAQALPAYGNKFAVTHNISQIMEMGARFKTAYTNYPLCLPARASFWTSRYPHQTKIISNGGSLTEPVLDESVPTLGSIFTEAGYRAFNFGKKHDAGSLRGFECAVNVPDMEMEDNEPVFPISVDTRRDRNTRKLVVDFLKNYKEDKPYVAIASFNNPHDICNWTGVFQGDRELPPFDGKVPDLPDNLYIDNKEFKNRPLPVQYMCCAHNRQAQIAEWSEDKIRRYLAAYHRFIERVDEEIGLVLNALRSRKDAGNTLVVFFADHGDSMCGRWMATKHTTFYDETIHVPLVFYGPGIEGRNKSLNGLVSLLDLTPTLCDYAGIDISGYEFEGKSLLPWLKGEKENESPHEYLAGQWYSEYCFTIEPGRMIRTARYKYTHYLEENGEELYDMENDPGEVRNRAGREEFKSILEEHRKILRGYVENTNDPYFNTFWKADNMWRSHKPGYRNHRGLAVSAYYRKNK
ncbi:MAG TPA: sulfatase [Lentisphaeria bacterium]|nr:MAG: hypothetical protein A2X48_13730 [Lentisphaerae bacterium GWF2_49_21]HBC89717.1 sulfatase [Lentisphaeria bacterium]